MRSSSSRGTSANFSRTGTYLEIVAFDPINGDAAMASNAGIFFAGVGSTFFILGAGFGGGLMMAKSALKEPTGYQSRVSAEPPSPARIILPTSAEAAQPPQPPQQIDATPPEPPIQLVKETQPALEKQIDKADSRKAEAEQRQRRKRYAERKAKLQAERAKRQQQIEYAERQEVPVVAFGGDEHRQSGGVGFFGN
jgi:type IV secretory pathway VirB10-like protein